jgi:osmoprotectant transport system permease protein
MSGLIDLARSQRAALWEATAAHLDLVLEAILLAVLIGVPLGVLAVRSRAAERIAVGVANVLQTVPSLALLGFLLILFGGVIGNPPALAALIVYAILPILQNTIVGLRSIDPNIIEAATGMGMTPWQRLRLVELPLALPVILGGVRIATVAAVGMATIAAAIGAKGLGSFIFRGVSLSDPRLILLGAVPAALLGLACDAVLGGIVRAFSPRKSTSRSVAVVSMLGAMALLAIAGWGWVRAWSDRARGPAIIIGSKDSTEPILLAHMLADLVEDRTPLRVDRRLNLGGTLVCYKAVALGGLDAYVEYTGTALTTILDQPPQNDPAVVLDRVRSLCRQRDGVVVLDPLGFENTFAILMRREQAGRLGISRISDLRAHQNMLRCGFGPEFMNRADGYPGLVRTYGLSFAIPPREMDRNLLYNAVAQGSIDVAAGDSTDGKIDALDLVVLEDDRRYFPPYEAVPMVASRTIEQHPELRDALNALAGRIDAPTMRRLNAEVDLKRRDPRAVAREFLQEQGLLAKANADMGP